MATAHDSCQMPPLAVLSRTRFHSPVVQTILTGCIRFVNQADAIFVGRNTVTIKEYGRDGLLSDVLSLSNFASPIVAAVVLGKRISKHLSHAHSANGGPGIKQEPLDHDMDSEAAETFSPAPHILALLLEAGELAFLSFSPPTGSHDCNVRQVCQPLPTAFDALEDWRFLAVDPDSRALSIASWSGKVALMLLSPSMDVQSVLLFETNMTILQMEFIFPNRGDNDLVYLLLVGRKDEKFRFMHYTWDLSKKLAPAKANVCSLEQNNPVPSLLIPLQSSPGAFLLASQQKLTIYEGVTTACITLRAEFTGRPVHIHEPSHNPESAVEQPPWTNWARGLRWYERTDSLFLAREDGVIYSLEISKENESSNELASYKLDKLDFVGSGEPTCLRGNIGGAFTSFDPIEGNSTGPDIILFAGDLSDGAHYEIGQTDKDATTTPKRLILSPDEKETFYNWAPFLHVTVVPSKASSKDTNKNPFRSRATVSGHGQMSNRGRIFGTCGKGAWGAVCEMRFGREFIVNVDFDIADWQSGVSNVWSAQNQLAGWKLSFFTTPYSTSCIQWSADGGIQAVPMDSEPTLVLAHLGTSHHLDPSRNSLVQVRPTGIYLLKIQQSVNDDSAAEFDCTIVRTWHKEHIVGASVDANSGLLALAMRQDEQACVYIGRIHCTESQEWCLTQLGEVIPCRDVPTCVELFCQPRLSSSVKMETNGNAFQVSKHLVAFATVSGDLCFSAIHPERGASSVQKPTLLENAICETLSIVPTGDSQGFWIVSGHRDGRLLVSEMQMQHDGSAVVLGRQRIFDIGAHSPSIRAATGNYHHGCIVYGGPDTCFLNLKGKDIDDVALENIWITDRANRSMRPSPVAAVCMFASNNGRGQESLSMLCLSSRGQVYVGTLGRVCEPLPRRIPIIGTPSRIIYSRHLQCLVVASTEVVVDLDQRKRYETAIVTLLDPDGEVDDSELGGNDGARADTDYGNQLAFRLPKVAERIKCLTEWQCSRGSSKYHLLIIGTAANAPQDALEGYLHLLRLHTHSDGNQELSIVKTSQEKGHVRAVCVWDERSFLYCAGNSIRMRTMSSESDVSFTKTKLVELTSPGVHLECRCTNDPATSIVVVTLLEGSTRVYRFNQDNTALELHLSDAKARLGLSHLLLHDKSLVLSSDKDQNIAGFTIPDGNMNSGAADPLFSANLEASITQMLDCDIRPPWKRRSSRVHAQKDLVAVTTDGSLLSLRILNDDTWRLLRFVTNMASRDARLGTIGQPRSGTPWQTHIEPNSNNLETRHIDGDLLARLLDRHDAVAVLNDMLAVPPIPEAFESETDFDTAGARRDRFIALADAALASAHDSGTVSGEDETALAHGDPVQWVLRFIKALLESPF